mmetsp:Transcript_15357/g.38814  ORF Transcript_15357/g.38814 Transcript_15357/m.38814 type:complete len:349 (-) Transcript_15357:802-1848(-)
MGRGGCIKATASIQPLSSSITTPLFHAVSRVPYRQQRSLLLLFMTPTCSATCFPPAFHTTPTLSIHEHTLALFLLITTPLPSRHSTPSPHSVKGVCRLRTRGRGGGACSSQGRGSSSSSGGGGGTRHSCLHPPTPPLPTSVYSRGEGGRGRGGKDGYSLRIFQLFFQISHLLSHRSHYLLHFYYFLVVFEVLFLPFFRLHTEFSHLLHAFFHHIFSNFHLVLHFDIVVFELVVPHQYLLDAPVLLCQLLRHLLVLIHRLLRISVNLSHRPLFAPSLHIGYFGAKHVFELLFGGAVLLSRILQLPLIPLSLLLQLFGQQCDVLLQLSVAVFEQLIRTQVVLQPLYLHFE